MKLLFTLLLLGATSTTALTGQDASPPTTVPEPKTLEVPGQTSTGPEDPGSPLAPTDEKLGFLARSNFIFGKILENHRSVDPFGFTMDPGSTSLAPVLADQYKEIEETPVLNNSSLKSALMTLPITGIYPHQNRIVIGARSFSAGGQFGMKLQELTIRLRFEGIRGKNAYFKDMETQEISFINYNPLPTEFEPLKRESAQERGMGIIPMNELFIVN
ncbi:MAG: hypothetical protein KA250_02135 [Verrucomicrobiales bacterium]|nr:hypothetical protein [Verrucomicrobiales bacterium]